MTLYDFKKKTLPVIVKIILGAALGVLVLLLTQEWFFEVPFLQNIELLSLDLRYQNKYEHVRDARNLEATGDVVLVGISDDDLKAFADPFPFPRDYYAHIIENLERAGARVIAFDMTFEAPGKTARGDSLLRETLLKYHNVVLAAKAESGTGNEKAVVRSTEAAYDNIFFDSDRNIGVVNIAKDRDDVCRSYFPLLDVQGWATPTLAFAALDRAYGLKPLTCVNVSGESFLFRSRVIPRYDRTSFLLNYYGPVGTFRYVPFSQVIDDSTFQTKDEQELGEQINAFDEGMMKLFKNKIVLIGSKMPEERDYHNIPLYQEEGGKKNNAMYGMEIHATAIQNVIDQNFVDVLNPSAESAIVVLLSICCFLGLCALKRIHVRHAWLLEIYVFLGTLLVIAGIFETAMILFTNANLLINIVAPVIAVVLAYLGTAIYQYLVERQQKVMIKNVFSHYINPSVVNDLVANPEKAKLGGDRRELTVFFADIAEFTKISEEYHDKPEQLVGLLNEYLDEMTNIILKCDGTLDKYEGDAIMAFWGAPVLQKNHAYHACLAALEMQKRLTILRTKWAKEGKPAIHVRIGINTGVMIVGNMGGRERFDYTVVGDSVNLASRLEGANKQYKSKIMISEYTYTSVQSQILGRELDLIQVEGKTTPVKVYELLGPADMKMTENQKQSLELYREGLQLYRERKWEEAIAYMEQAHQLDGTCFAAEIYIERAHLYQLAPPPASWNGVFVMTSK
jgi:adenylate cyclase